MRYHSLPVPFTFQFIVTTQGTPEQLSVKRVAATIAFVDNDPNADTITDSANGFLVAGFEPGDQLVVSGSASNDGTYEIASVTAGTITLHSRHALTAEGAGTSITLTADKKIAEGVEVVIKANKDNSGDITLANTSARALNTATGHFVLDANESVRLTIDLLSRVWLDTTNSGDHVEVLFEKNIPATLG